MRQPGPDEANSFFERCLGFFRSHCLGFCCAGCEFLLLVLLVFCGAALGAMQAFIRSAAGLGLLVFLVFSAPFHGGWPLSGAGLHFFFQRRKRNRSKENAFPPVALKCRMRVFLTCRSPCGSRKWKFVPAAETRPLRPPARTRFARTALDPSHFVRLRPCHGLTQLICSWPERLRVSASRLDRATRDPVKRSQGPTAHVDLSTPT